MKANELMIGDWVQFDGTPQRVNYINLEDGERVATDKNYFAMPSGCYNPIPLTSEILEKNGFEKTTPMRYISSRLGINEQYIYRIGELKDDAYITKVGDYVQIKLPNDWLPVLPIQYIGKCKYVHTLQHALRICGLNELADNFKI